MAHHESSQTPQNTRESLNPHKARSWQQKLRADWIGLLGASAPIAAALATSGRVKVFMIWLAVVFAVLLAVYLLIQLPGPRSWQGTQERAARFVKKTVLPIAAGASLTLAGGVLLNTAANASDNCTPPPVLRVMAAPENLRTATRAAQDFAAAQQADGPECVPVRLTVFEAPPPGRLQEEFEGSWDLSERPHPDIWLPATGAVVGPSTTAALTKRRLGVSPLVLAVSKPVGRTLELQEAEPGGWNDLIGRLRSQDVELLLPDPESTETGLAGVYVLFTASTADDEQARGRRHDLIRRVNRDGAAETDPDEVLCRLQRLGRERPDSLHAAIVPLANVEAYNSGGSDGSCGGTSVPDSEQLVPVRPTKGTPDLDASVVHVRWHGDDDEVRKRLAGRFVTWLAGHGSAPGTSPPGGPARPLTPEQLRHSRDLMTQARKSLSLEFMIDYSGTMNTPSADGTLLAGAKTFVDDALDRLGPKDNVGLSLFPASHAVAPSSDVDRGPSVLTGSAPADPAHVKDLRDGLNRLGRARASVTPLFHAITMAAESSAGAQGGNDPQAGAGGQRSLVVLTDGENYDPGRSNEGLIPRLKKALRGPGGVRVHVVVLKETGCPRDLRGLENSAPRFHCLDLKRTGNQLLDGLFTELSQEG